MPEVFMTDADLDVPCERSLTLRDLVHAGETWAKVRIPNHPRQPETIVWLHRLAEQVLDPVAMRFGAVRITYGFTSPDLIRYIPGRIDPSRDQHAGHELRRDGRLVCPRGGQAVDFQVPGVCSGRVAAFIAAGATFDRIYFYGSDRPLHVSVGPEAKHTVVAMRPGRDGRRIPRVRSPDWLVEQFAPAL